MEGVRPRAAAELVASGQWVASLAKCAEGSGLDCWVEPKRTFLTRPTFKSHGRCLSLPFELDTKSTPALQRPLLQAVKGWGWSLDGKTKRSLLHLFLFFCQPKSLQINFTLIYAEKKVRPEFQHLLPLPFSFPFLSFLPFSCPPCLTSPWAQLANSVSPLPVSPDLSHLLFDSQVRDLQWGFFGQWKHIKSKRITLLHLPKSLGYQITISNLKKLKKADKRFSQ